MPVPDLQSSLPEWLAYLETLHKSPIDLGLDRIRAVADRLSLELPYLKITVAGTNGKGSTCAMLEAILQAAGYRVGTYSSPHLVRYNERIRINGDYAADAQIIEQFHRINLARKEITLSYFEFSTLAALMLFEQERMQVAVLEVGLGGRLDAVNMVDTDCAIITSIDIDHADYLGDTREKIGFEKAGIFRSGKPAIVSDPVCPQSVIDHAHHVGADLWLFGHDFNYSGDRQQWAYGGRDQRRAGLAYPALRGANQLLNASAVLAALEALRLELVVPQQAVRIGLAQVTLPGRFQVLPGTPVVIIDVSHNPQAAGVLARNLEAMGQSFTATHAVVGIYADKDIPAVLDHLADQVDHWHCVGLDGPRGTSASDLAEKVRQAIVRRAGKGSAAAAPSVPDERQFSASPIQASEPDLRAKPGVRPAVSPVVERPEPSISLYANPVAGYLAARNQAGGNDRIVVFGSFAVVGPVLEQTIT